MQPYLWVGVVVTYLTMGRFDLAKNPQVVPVMEQDQILASGQSLDSKEPLYAKAQLDQP